MSTYATLIANESYLEGEELTKEEWGYRERMIDILKEINEDDLQFLMMMWDKATIKKQNLFLNCVFARHEAELVNIRGDGSKQTLEQEYAIKELCDTYSHRGHRA